MIKINKKILIIYKIIKDNNIYNNYKYKIII